MKCPNCGASLSPEKIGSTVYWRCKNCGALWFDNKECDFLTEEEAVKLSKLEPEPSFSKLKYFCPRDKKPLKFDNHYYRCYSCGGILTSANAIVEEKRARREQFSSGSSKPVSFSQMKGVVIFAAVILFLVINFNLINNLKSRLTSTTQAHQVETGLQIRKLNQNKLVLYFTTEEPYRSKAIFKNNKREWKQTISPEYTLNHFLIINKPDLQTTVKIELTSIKNEIQFTKPIVLLTSGH
jgi:Zn-finger nucleic acid-binding protein